MKFVKADAKGRVTLGSEWAGTHFTVIEIPDATKDTLGRRTLRLRSFNPETDGEE